MSTAAVTNQDRKILRDCTVLALANLPDGGGAAGTALDFIGIIETVEIGLPKREFVDTTGSADTASSSRAARFGKGSVKLTGFSAATASKFATIWAQGSHAAFSFTEGASSDSYSLLCLMEEFSVSLGKDANKHTLSLPTEGQPYLNGTAIPIE